MVSDGDGEKKPTKEEKLEAITRKNCFQEGDMNKEEERKAWWRSKKINKAMGVAAIYGEDKHQLNNGAKEAGIHDEREELEMFKAEHG